MEDKYSVINIKAFLNRDDEDTYIGEDGLRQILSDFSCPKNPDVEHFIKENAIEFTKKQQSITYIVLDNFNASLVGYFSLTIKPISIRAASITNKTEIKRLKRISTFDKDTQSYIAPAYLIAQLGKNYSLPKEQRIEGSALLDFALDTISTLQYSIGGLLEFLECEDSEFLLDFYQKNKFRKFDTRISTSNHDNEDRLLHQLLKFI